MKGQARSAREDLLRAAIRETLSSARDDDLEWAPLYGLIRSDRDRQILREETAPPQVALDLHLSGPGVDGHATNADLFAAFVQRIGEATKAVARDIAGVSRYGNNLLIDGVSPGSVRVILRAPDAKTAQPVLERSVTETADSRALRRVAGVLSLASEDDVPSDGSDPLDAAVQGLPPQARESLRSAARDVLTARWHIDGSVRQWRQPEDRITITPRGAQHLRVALSRKAVEPQRRTIVGTLDGFRRSTGVAYIDPDRTTEHPLAIVVSDAELFHRVAHMAVQDDLPVRVIVDEWQVERSDGTAGRMSRRMVSIESLGFQEDILLGLPD